MAEAIFGLVGVVVGALSTGGIEYVSRKRQERAEVRAACRLLDLELLWLETFARQADAGTAEHRQALARWQKTSELWHGHRSLLAQVLTADEWSQFGPKFVGFDVDLSNFPSPDDDPKEAMLWWGTISADAAEARTAVWDRL